jgi:hypothetical protein
MQYPVIRYRARISGPLLDRIDIYIEAPALSIRELQNDKPGESSAVIRERIQAARERQLARFAESNAASSRQVPMSGSRSWCTPGPGVGKRWRNSSSHTASRATSDWGSRAMADSISAMVLTGANLAGRDGNSRLLKIAH